MTEATALAVVDPTARELANHAAAWSSEKLQLIANTVAAGTTEDEFHLFIEVCRRTGLDPLTRQIYCIVRGRGDRRKMTIQTGIDGYRLIAERSGLYDGQDPPAWCGEDGIWREVWTAKEHPFAAKVSVYKKGQNRPAGVGIAHWSEYAQKGYDGNLVDMWRNMPANQLAKCAEALAIRKAFPADLSGVYTAEEMGQVDNDQPPPTRNAAREAMANTVARSDGSVVNKQTGEVTGAEPTPMRHWTQDLEVEVKKAGKKMADLAPLIEGTVTRKALTQWAERMGFPGPEQAIAHAVSWLKPKDEPAPAGDEIPEGDFEELEQQENPSYPAAPTTSLHDKLGIDDHTVAPDGTSIGMATPLDPDEIPFEDNPDFDEGTFWIQVQSVLGAVGIGVGRNVDWKDLAKAFSFNGKTQEDVKQQLLAHMKATPTDDPVSYVRDSLFRSLGS